MSRSNCIVWAVLLRRRLPQSYLLIRRSRLAPSWVPHVLVAIPRKGGLRVVSYIPIDTRPLPWWRVWRALFYRGRVRWGDR